MKRVIIAGGAVEFGSGVDLRLRSLMHSSPFDELWIVNQHLSSKVCDYYATKYNVLVRHFKPNWFDRLYGVFRSFIFGLPIQSALFFNIRARRLANSGLDRFTCHTVRPLVMFDNLSRIECVDICEKMSITFREGAIYHVKKFRIFLSLIYYIDAFRLKNTENIISKNILHSIICKSESLNNIDKESIIIQRVEYSSYPDINAMNNLLYFIGPESYFPNSLSVASLDKCMWRFSEIHIIGKGHRVTRSLSSHTKIFTHGWVDNLDEVIRSGGFGWAFFDAGRGVQNKVFDYLKLGLVPLMSNRVFLSCFEDLNINDFGSIVADHPSQFYKLPLNGSHQEIHRKLWSSMEKRFYD